MSLFQGVGNGYIKTYADENQDVSIAAEAVEDSEVTERVDVAEDEVKNYDFAQEAEMVTEDVQEVVNEENEIKQEDEVILNYNLTNVSEDVEIDEESVEIYDSAECVVIDGLKYEVIDEHSVEVTEYNDKEIRINIHLIAMTKK